MQMLVGSLSLPLVLVSVLLVVRLVLVPNAP